MCTTREKLSDRYVRLTFGGNLCQGLGHRCKNARWLNILRVPFLVRGCLPEINIETNPTYFCRVKDAGHALHLRPTCQNFGGAGPKMNVV